MGENSWIWGQGWVPGALLDLFHSDSNPLNYLEFVWNRCHQERDFLGGEMGIGMKFPGIYSLGGSSLGPGFWGSLGTRGDIGVPNDSERPFQPGLENGAASPAGNKNGKKAPFPRGWILLDAGIDRNTRISTD